MIEHERGNRILATRRPRRRRSWRRVAASVAGVTLAGTALAACGTSSAATGPVTLNYYLYPDTSGATQTAINNCDAQSHGAYKISYQHAAAGLRRPAPADGPAARRA